MATQSTATTSTISTVNMVQSCYAVTNEATNYPKTNLSNPLRSKRWRSIGTGQIDLDFDLGSSQLPTVFALVDSNLSASQTITIYASASSVFSSGETYTYTSVTYTQSQAGIIRIYLGNPDSGSATARRYWRVRLPNAGTSATYHELGAVWFGTYYSIPIDLGASNKIIDQSKVSVSYSGARYFDRIRTYRDIDFNVPLTREADGLFTFERALEVCGGSSYVLLDMYGWTTDTAKKASSAYYGTLDIRGGISLTTRFQQSADIKLSFSEAVA